MASQSEKQKIIDQFTDSIEKGDLEEAILNLNNIIKNRIKVGAQQPQIIQQNSLFLRQKQQQQQQEVKPIVKIPVKTIPKYEENIIKIDKNDYQNDMPDESFYTDYPDLNRGQVQKIYLMAKDNRQTFRAIYEGGYWQYL